MQTLRYWIPRLLLLLGLALVLPGGEIDCDMEDGELEVDFDDFDDDCGWWGDCYYEEYYVEPCLWCY